MEPFVYFGASLLVIAVLGMFLAERSSTYDGQTLVVAVAALVASLLGIAYVNQTALTIVQRGLLSITLLIMCVWPMFHIAWATRRAIMAKEVPEQSFAMSASTSVAGALFVGIALFLFVTSGHT